MGLIMSSMTVPGNHEKALRSDELWSLRIKYYHFAPWRLGALARMSLLIQAVVLAKAQRRKGRKGKILAMVVLKAFFAWVFRNTKPRGSRGSRGCFVLLFPVIPVTPVVDSTRTSKSKTL